MEAQEESRMEEAMRHVRHLEGKDLVEKKLNCCIFISIN
jgi:hypothetical protein